MAKSPKSKSTSKPSSNESVFTMDAATLNERAREFERRVREAQEALLPGLHRYDRQTRQSSLGRYRNGEAAAIGALLRAAEAEPDFFRALTRRDGGTNPSTLELAPATESLARRAALATASTLLTKTARTLGDTVLSLGESPRSLSLAIYALGKPIYEANEGNAAFRAAMAEAVDFFNQSSGTRKTPAGPSDE